MKTPILLIFAFLLSGFLYGQDEVMPDEFTIKGMFKDVEKRKRSSLYKFFIGLTEEEKKQEKATKSAPDLINKFMKRGRVDAAMFPQIANAYRLNGEMEKAEIYYARFVSEDSKLEDIFNFAHVLQSNDKCEEAIEWFNVFNEQAPAIERNNIEFIEDCNELADWPLEEGVEVVNVSSLNTEHIDFSAVPFNNGVVFTSTRAVDNITKHIDKWTNDHFSNLFYSDMDSDGNFTSPKPFKPSINKKYHDGVCAFSNMGNTMYFTRNNVKGKNNKGVIDLKIYSATYTDGYWTNIKELPFNSDEWTSCHPSVTADGKFMIFSSNRPGGMGGMDLWVAKNEGGTWTAPVNMGEEINTAGNELFPFYGQDELLYFSSNGHKGMGGLDIFYAMPSNNEMTSWETRTNCGQPFNTPNDDFSFYTNKDNTSGFFTSNRAGGKGKDDIYMWKKAKVEAQEMTVTVKDQKTGKTLNNVKVTMMEVSNGSMDLMTEKEVKAGINKMPKNQQSFVMSSLKNMKGNVTSKSMKKSDRMGQMNFMWQPNTEYIMILEKDGYQIKNDVMTMADMSNGSYIVNMNSVAPPKPKPAPKPAPKKTVPAPRPPVVKRTPAPAMISSAPVSAGQVITLQGIYYDYDSFALRTESKTELDKIVQTMKEHPSLEIRLGAHTDSRGNDNSNMKLSQNRADAAMKYIVSQGIEPTRVRAAGFGESQLKNHCTNGKDCDEEMHQMNRRTEVTILKYNQGGTIIQTNN